MVPFFNVKIQKKKIRNDANIILVPVTKNLKGIPKLLVKFMNVVRQCWFCLLHPEHLILQPPQIQVMPEMVYKTLQNEQGVLQNPTGWFVLSSKERYVGSCFSIMLF